MKHYHFYRNGRYERRSLKEFEYFQPGRRRLDGVFETMLYEKGMLLMFPRHWQRLQKGLRLYRIACSIDRKQCQRIIAELLKRNRLTHARVRVSVWRDKKTVHTVVVVLPAPSLPARYSLMISSIKRIRTRYAHVKSLDYGLFRQAWQKARGEGFHEAVLLNTNGRVVEGATSNVFIVKGGRVITPPVRCGCLNGVTRSVVLALLKRQGIVCSVRPVSAQDLQRAREIFLTNSLIGVMPVNHLNTKKLSPPVLTPKIRSAYRVFVRELSDNAVA